MFSAVGPLREQMLQKDLTKEILRKAFLIKLATFMVNSSHTQVVRTLICQTNNLNPTMHRLLERFRNRH